MSGTVLRVAATFFLLLLCACSAPRGPLSGVSVEGRFERAGDALRFGFPGARISFNAPGPVTLDVESTGSKGALDIRLPGQVWERRDLRQGRQTLTLPIAAPGRVEIVRRNESWQGDLILHGVTPLHGTLGPAPALPTRKILFIGDSITAGAGTDVSVEDAGLGKPLDSARLAFPRILGDRLDAQVHHVAYGGRGIVRDWRGYPTGRDGVRNAPDFYERAAPDGETEWRAERFKPDAVVIGLGTNDFNEGVPDRSFFVDSYADFLATIRADYPGVPILLLNSPMTGGDKGRTLEGYLDRVAEVAGEGVHRLNTARYEGRPSVVGHPTDAQHIAIADEIEPVLRTLIEGD